MNLNRKNCKKEYPIDLPKILENVQLCTFDLRHFRQCYFIHLKLPTCNVEKEELVLVADFECRLGRTALLAILISFYVNSP